MLLRLMAIPVGRAIWVIRGVTLLLFVLLIFSIAALSYASVCISQKRKLTSDEKINLALQYANNRLTIPVDGLDRGSYTQVKYSSIEEIRRLYPNCCDVGEHVAGDIWPPTFWQRIRGEYADKVSVQYTAHYLNDAGEKVPYDVKWVYVMTNCGVWQD